jgi:hypothetical protein
MSARPDPEPVDPGALDPMSAVSPSSVPIYIYALTDDDGSIRYIGQTANIERRLADHHLTATSEWMLAGGPAYLKWLKSLGKQGKRPLLVVLEETDVEHADEAEDRHIAEHRARGCALTNGPKAFRFGRVRRVAARAAKRAGFGDGGAP